MKHTPMKLSGLCTLEPDVHEDSRGFFMETYRADVFASFGITTAFVQDSHSHSIEGVIRGLKFQFNAPTDKLVRVVAGKIFAVGVDIRPHSKTFGKWESVELSAENKKQLYLPFGFAFGFCALTDADVLYKLSATHNEGGSGTIRWNDPDIGVDWPVKEPIISTGDAKALLLGEWMADGALEKVYTSG